MSKSSSTTRKKAGKKKPAKRKRPYVQVPVATDPGVPCRHCGHLYDHTVTNTYPNGNRRVLCGSPDCGKPFVIIRVQGECSG